MQCGVSLHTDSGTCTVAWLVCSYRKISLVYWALLGDIIEKHEIIYRLDYRGKLATIIRIPTN